MCLVSNQPNRIKIKDQGSRIKDHGSNTLKKRMSSRELVKERRLRERRSVWAETLREEELFIVI
jgi:hypothetical protein